MSNLEPWKYIIRIVFLRTTELPSRLILAALIATFGSISEPPLFDFKT
jgi:hypothetical protein